MEIIESREGDTTIIEPIGRLDNNSTRSFERKIESVTAGETPVLIIDCSRLDYVSSSGLRNFLVAAKRITNAKGRLVLCAMQSHVKEVFDVSGFSSILNIRATRKEALIQAAKGAEVINPQGGTRPGSQLGGSRPGGARPGGARPGGSRPSGARVGGTRPEGPRQEKSTPAQSETASPARPMEQPVSRVESEESFESEPLPAEPVESSPAEISPTRPVGQASSGSVVAKRPSRPVPPRPPSTRSASKPGRRFAPPPPPSAKAPEAPPVTAQPPLVSGSEAPGSEAQPASQNPPARMLRSGSRFPR